MTTKVFIDGEVGTTGLQIRSRLNGRDDLDFISLGEEKRKDAGARKEALNEADIVILCLPDDAAKEAVSLIANGRTRVIDASTAHRVADGWVYGFPEMSADQRQVISGASRVTNPGCYPTGAIALVKPLADAGLLPAGWPLTVNAVSGYSGGGKQMIAQMEDETHPEHIAAPHFLYGLPLAHKHVPEMKTHGLLARAPIFSPSVGRFAQGMIVQVPLHLADLSGAPRLGDIHAALEAHYAGQPVVEVVPLAESAALTRLDPTALNGTDAMRLYVFGTEGKRQANLVAVLDNLGKGASGAAVQNMALMLGVA